jgi:hypothetical protein
MSAELQQPASVPNPSEYSVPWTIFDSWLGVVMLALIDAILFIITLQSSRRADFAQSAGILFLELAYLLPVLLIFAWKRIHWKHLGFRKFEPKVMSLGCGLLIGGYLIILLHNLILLGLGIDTQGEAILRLIEMLKSPGWFFLVYFSGAFSFKAFARSTDGNAPCC